MNYAPIRFANATRIAHPCASMRVVTILELGSAGIDRAVERHLK